MGINLRGGQTTVPQKLFNSIQVGAIIHEMGGKGMAEHMGAFFVKGACCPQNPVDKQVSIFRVKPFSFFCHQQSIISFFSKGVRGMANKIFLF